MGKKYAWASITKSCENFGNYLIEYNLEKILAKKGFAKPAYVFDAFKNYSKSEQAEITKEINSLDFLIVPGCTTLTTRFYPGIRDIVPLLSIPTFNIGGAYGVKSDNVSNKFAKNYFQPIGVRDPVSDQILKSNGIKSKLIGCPTLFSGNATQYNINADGSVLFNFGVGHYPEQINLLDHLIETEQDVRVIIQTNEQLSLVNNKECKLINYTPTKIINEGKNAKIMITGRLHASLPSLSNGTPVFFVETIEDTRFSLLSFIGLDFHSPKNLVEQYQNFKPTQESKIYKNIDSLRTNFFNYLDYLNQ